MADEAAGGRGLPRRRARRRTAVRDRLPQRPRPDVRLALAERAAPGAFHDSGIPTWYAPHGIPAFGNRVFVSYAWRAPVNGNDAPPGGYVDEFDLNGRLITRVGAKRRARRAVGNRPRPGGVRPVRRRSPRREFRKRPHQRLRARGRRVDVPRPAPRQSARRVGDRVRRRRCQRPPDDPVLRRRSASLARRDRGGRRRRVRLYRAFLATKRRARRARPAGRPAARVASGSSISWIAIARGQGAELPAVLADRRERRVGERSGLEIVEPDDRDVASRLEPGFPDCLEGRERHQVRRGHDRRRALGESEQCARFAVAGSRREIAQRGDTPQGPSTPAARFRAKRVQPLDARDRVLVAPATCAIRRWPSTCRCARASRTPSAWSEPT